MIDWSTTIYEDEIQFFMFSNRLPQMVRGWNYKVEELVKDVGGGAVAKSTVTLGRARGRCGGGVALLEVGGGGDFRRVHGWRSGNF
jgi:hypothetical protein